MQQKKQLKDFSSLTVLKFLICSAIGIFVFFVQFEAWTGPRGAMPRNSIAVDHIAWLIRQLFGQYGAPVGNVRWVALAMITYGSLRPFFLKTWNKNISSIVFSLFRLLGLVFAALFLTNSAPAWMLSGATAGSMLPFLFNALAVMLTFLIPLGAVFLVFLTSFGLMEFAGVMLRPFMRRVFKVPGRAAVDAVGSFVGSYAIALLITDQQYQEKKYTKKEAAIIATGFSTVSAAFVLVVSNTLGLTEYWNRFFWSSMLITFIVTAITIRLFPLRGMKEEYVDGSTEVYVEPSNEHGGLFKTALFEAFSAAEKSGNIFKLMGQTFIHGINITSNFVPTILSIGLVGLLLVEFTPVFDIIGFLFFPFTWLIGVSEPMLVARAVSTSLAEMLLPAVLVQDLADIATRYVVGVVCISSILFFSACIPCIKGTSIPVSIRDIVIIWFFRVIFSILLAGAFAWILF